MEAIKFKTNIKCTGCISTVTPNLNKIAGENNWQVDLQDPQKILTVEGDASAEEVVKALKEAGYEAQRI